MAFPSKGLRIKSSVCSFCIRAMITILNTKTTKVYDRVKSSVSHSCVENAKQAHLVLIERYDSELD